MSDSKQQRCMGCMQPLPEGREECGLCGYPVNGENPTEYLPVGTRLSDRYVIGRVLSVSGDTALYIGYDETGDAPVFVREFLPGTLCRRQTTGEVQPIGGCETTFAEYLEQYRSLVRVLARLRDLPILVPIFDIFDQNQTTYAVGEYCEGVPLTEYLHERGGRLSWDEARRLFLPFVSAFVSCHTAGVYHYGICPDNLLVDTDGRLRLLEFSLPQVRMTGTDLKPALASGYAAPEQYEFDRTLTPATDVYGLAATLFTVLTGNPPPEGSMRDAQGRDLLLSAEVANSLPGYVASALVSGLQALPDKRTPTVLAFRDKLATGAMVSTLSEEEDAAQPRKKKGNDRRKYAVILAVGLIALVLIVGFLVILALYPQMFKSNDPDASATTTTVGLPTTTAEPTTTVPSAIIQVVPDLGVGMVDYYVLPISQGMASYGGFQVQISGLVFSDQPYGMIMSQSPAAGSNVAEGTVLQVVISAGKQATTVPDVSGWKAEHAKLYLEALGFKVTTLEEEYPSVEKGIVIGTWPSAGSAPDAGKGNQVTLRVSTWVRPTTQPTEPPTRPTTAPTEPPDIGDGQP